MEFITYAKAGETPADWYALDVVDTEARMLVANVVEANTVEGWVRVVKLLGGRLARDSAGDLLTERIDGAFQILRAGWA